ncbi:hypothetical protein D3C75_1120900 [compost metagenome]
MPRPEIDCKLRPFRIKPGPSCCQNFTALLQEQLQLTAQPVIHSHIIRQNQHLIGCEIMLFVDDVKQEFSLQQDAGSSCI